MKTRPKKNIKKLSEAIKRGLKIAEENGIQRGKFELARLDWQEEEQTYKVGAACALGMAYIGLNGAEKADNATYGALEEAFPVILKENKCLSKAANKFKNVGGVLHKGCAVETVVVTMNDYGVPIPKIIEKLEKCGL